MKLTLPLLFFLSLQVIAIGTFSQKQRDPLENFRNPFKTKVDNNNSQNVIMPNEGKTSTGKVGNEGNFFIEIKSSELSGENFEAELRSFFSLSEDYQFIKIKESTDQLGFTHVSFQQYYKSILMEGCMVLVHLKNGKVQSVNGKVLAVADVTVSLEISKEQGKSIAKSYLKVTELMNDYPVETLIGTLAGDKENKMILMHKVRIDSYSPFEMCYVYVNAITGAVVNKINLNAHADVNGTAQTLYSGAQSIISDSYAGGYRLRDNGRKIETYNATNATGTVANGFAGSSDFTNGSANWNAGIKLSSFTISAVAQNWWFTSLADELPDLYIKVKDGANQTIYTSGYVNNTHPPFTFNNLNVFLTAGSYIVELWDYDAVGGDDYGGSSFMEWRWK